ncbi:poly(A)-specific ribonuclease PARN-like [Littorina saxatilis]|uniref:Poly(A)-specific ribonuclease PARN n=1 Tax=Littorina saxatilis TaxID=31220 RepID=A0AAN9BUQ1_9CAEN
MEITRSNLTEKLEEIAEAIDQATFLAVDGEFTGLDKPDCSHSAPFDTAKERYFKLKEGSLEFLMIQFGVCAFKFKEDTQSYEARPFNFYVFPRPYTRQAPDKRFLCQSSSIDFLVQQGFDFNKLFREGIPFLMPTEEDVMRESLAGKHQAFSKFSSPAFVSPDGADMGPGKGPVQIPDEQKDFIAGVCNKISSFIETSESEVLQLAPCNGFQRKLIYQTIRTKFSAVHLETKTGEKKDRFIVVTKVASEDDLKKKEKDKQNAEIMELEEAVGFSKVMKLISKSGKLVIGHNMILDVMHMLNDFLCPLPADLEEFKSMVKCCLPRLIDTKFMASTHPLRDVIPNTALGNLQETLEKGPFTPAKVELMEGFSDYQNATDKYHEAGYDAYVTGCMFATMTNYIGNYKKPDPKPAVAPTEAVLKPFMNKLFLMRIADIPYLNLGGPDLEPNRDHVFHLSFPREWKSADINNLFAPYGSIHISWLNDSSAFVSLFKKDNAAVVLKTLAMTQSQYQLVPYNVYKSKAGVASSLMPPPVPEKASSFVPVSTPTPLLTGLKRSAADPAADDDDSDSNESASKKQRSANKDAAPLAAMEEDEIPELVPRSEGDSDKSSNGRGVTNTPQKMFAEPEVW